MDKKKADFLLLSCVRGAPESVLMKKSDMSPVYPPSIESACSDVTKQ
jgi:hypothetical protein